MTYLVFTSQSDADNANAAISANMGCPVIGVDSATGLPDPTAQQTTQWAIPQETLLNTWVFPMPNNSLMNGVVNYTQAEYSAAWFPTLSF